MSFTESLISGVVQGLTEFLPVSSSGHLVLVHYFFGFKEPSVLFDICLHVATLGAILLYFWRDVLGLFTKEGKHWLPYILFATIPAVFMALLFDEKIIVLFQSTRKVGLMLLATSFILLVGHIALKENHEKGGRLEFRSSFLIGISQAFALLPGISRSGVTISTGLVARVKAEDAFKFSFLLSIPAIIGALFFKIYTIKNLGAVNGNIPVYLVGMLAAFLSGLAGLRFLWGVIRHKKLFIFAIYCFFAGLAAIFLT